MSCGSRSGRLKTKCRPPKGGDLRSERIDKRKNEFAKYIDEISRHYSEPFMRAVATLPRQDLAKMAEVLVNLTAFLMQMRMSKAEPVTWPVDVAILSKGDGIIWAKTVEVASTSGVDASLRVLLRDSVRLGPARTTLPRNRPWPRQVR
jgi:hypothetical protein